MRILSCGVRGADTRDTPGTWGELGLEAPWLEVLAALEAGTAPRPVQAEVLRQNRLFTQRRNLIVSAPTNSGKSLVGLLAMLDAVRRGRRAVLLEPLRAIAREKADELEEVAPRLGKALGRSVKIQISTGDYRLDTETLSAPPPDQGELIIATPERLEAIIRNPDYDAWVASIDVVVVDEAHLIGAHQRGARLEYLLTTLLCMDIPPRLLLLSATIGGLERIQEWLDPCDVVVSTERHPALEMQVGALEEGEEASVVVVDYARKVLSDPSASLMVFVYQTKSAEQLATAVHKGLGDLTGSAGAMAYHGQMNAADRAAARAAVMDGRCRCLVTTTALAMGVNLPTTHVLVRDITFPGVGQLEIGDLLQMMGRAGRGDRTGQAIALVRPGDGWKPEQLAQALSSGDLPSLVSHFERMTQHGGRWGGGEPDIPAIASCVAAQLGRFPERGLSLDELQRFFARSLGGKAILRSINSAIFWLTDPSQSLAYLDEREQYHLTVLGLKATRGVIPLSVAAGYGQLIRDLISLDPEDHLLAGWRPLDHLFCLALLSDRSPSLRRFSADLTGQIDSWMEQRPSVVPLLYRKWVAGEKDASRSVEVLGSLGLRPPRTGVAGDEWARQQAYVGLLTAVVLQSRGEGIGLADLERQWKVTGFAGTEERLRDEFLWLLSGIATLLDLRCFYFHLRESCEADLHRVRRTKRLLQKIRGQVFDLMGELQYCSALGPMLRSLRGMLKGGKEPLVGVQTFRRLEERGINTPAELAKYKVDDLVGMGIRKQFAKQIITYLARRSR
jgi:helicase